DLAAQDAPAERALAADEAVDDRRVGLQLHPLGEPVDEHAGHPAALVGAPGLLLDDRGQNDELLRRLDRQVGRAPGPDLVQRLAMRALHAAHDLLTRFAALEL